VSLTVYPSAPGLFYLNYNSVQAAILNADGSINSTSNSAKPGDVISLFGTGGGPASLPGVTGGYWGPGPNPLAMTPVYVQIGGVSSQVLYAGAAPGLLSGIFQIDVRIPPGLHSAVMGGPSFGVTVGIGGLGADDTPAPATVAVQ
jgi:uncharacterized protein (TIGR03437 family)